MNEAYNIDCMEYMKTVPDKYFDLAIVDPPYGGGADDNEWKTPKAATRGRFGGKFDKYYIGTPNITAEDIKAERTGGSWSNKYQGDNTIKNWDIAPPPEYFEELARVSKNQIIWGANYFGLPPTRCFLVWRKLTISENFSMAMAEYAWTSFNDNAKVFEYVPQGKDRFHPTQKPVALYDWILKLFAKDGDKILDTHLGSGSSRIAAYKRGLDFVGCEIDKVYFDKQEERFAEFTNQLTIFDL